jgi:hypothetical protein
VGITNLTVFIDHWVGVEEVGYPFKLDDIQAVFIVDSCPVVKFVVDTNPRFVTVEVI